MGGKAAMLLVLGFSLIFLVMGQNFNSLSTRSVDNYTNYYTKTVAHNLAVTGANLAANRIFKDKTWDNGFSNLTMQDGIINVYVTNLFAASSKVKVCHKPNTLGEHTISVNASAVPHLIAHGDYLGSCGGAGPNVDVVIYAEGIFPPPSMASPIYPPDTASIYVELNQSSFAQYGNFYDHMNNAWPATGDTFAGRFHVNSTLHTWGSPTFLKDVTSKGGLDKRGTKNPNFLGKYKSGVDLPRPWDTTKFRSVANSGGFTFKDTTGAGNRTDVQMEFKNNGKVKFRSRIFDGSATWSPYKTEKLTTLAPNGLINIEKGNLFVKGTVKGKVSVVVTAQKNVSSTGNIYQTDDLKYKTNPLTHSASNDMLGLIAENKIRLQYNNNTKHHDIVTQASMYAMNGDIGPDNALVTNDHVLSSWRILGGIIANDVRVTAHYSNKTGQPYEGYRFVQVYDERFLVTAPPYFPSGKFGIVAWYE